MSGRYGAVALPFVISFFFFFPLSFSLLILEDESLADGSATVGQTVLHVYLHPLPRYLRGDSFAGTRNDEVFNKLEKQEGALPQDLTGASDSHTGPGLLEPLKVDADAMRARGT